VASPLQSSIPTSFVISPILVSSTTNDDSEDENPIFPTFPPLVEFIENDPTKTPQLPTWFHTTQEGTGDIASDPSYYHHKFS